MDLIKLDRVTKDIGIFGLKGSFKTTLIVLIGALEYYFYKTQIFTNIKGLKIPHIYIKTIEEAKELITGYNRKLFIGDDFERWFYSRNWQKNFALSDILLDWGKYYTSVLYTGKRERAIDIGLIESTVEFWYNIPKLTIRSNTGDLQLDSINNNILKKYANFLKITVERYDNNLDQLPSLTIKNLGNIFSLFDTHEIIEEVTYQ